VYYTYILRSKTHPEQTYVGSTQDLKRRLSEHNSAKSPHTSKYVPWDLSVYVAFPAKRLAEEFERYLKSGSGRAFAKKRLLSL
jgi:predicted GIY-YIG superfamily endonuclease